jgi:two-component sensor histidine kinase
MERSMGKKMVLRRELRHRVRGNLQTITSLLQIQIRGVEDEAARRSLEESRGRVAAMGLLHERLYRAGAPDRVELAGYLQSLAADVIRTRGAQGRVRASLSLEPMKVAVDDAIACGLIVHELVANAVTHAFPADATGTVSLELRQTDGRTVLRVADDGEGMRGAGPEAASSLGLQIVEALVGQLEGDLEVRTVGGTRVTIHFPTDDHDAVVASKADTPTGA